MIIRILINPFSGLLSPFYQSDIDATIEAAMSAQFFVSFSAELGVSVSTGYDWTQTSSEAKSETQQFKVETSIRVFKRGIINQF